MLTVVKKAAKLFYFLKHLKPSSFPKVELESFYITCIRSVCQYAIPVFLSLLPEYLVKDLEQVQKRALAIICSNQTYSDALLSINLDSLEQHHHHLTQSLLKGISLIVYVSYFHLSHSWNYVSFNTNRAKCSFLNFYCIWLSNNNLYLMYNAIHIFGCNVSLKLFTKQTCLSCLKFGCPSSDSLGMAI